MIESFFTKDQKWLDKWDLFLQENERGLYNQLSDWIKAYTIYGFDYDFYLITKNDQIIGGCGIVIAKFSIFKFYIIPCGPVLSNGFENRIDETILVLKNDAIKKGSCYFQISAPINKNKIQVYNYTLPEINENSIYNSGQNGTKFKYVIPLFGKRLIHLDGKNYEQVAQSFSKNHKRNILKAQSYNLEFKYVNYSNEIKQAYSCFELNAKEKGYPLRSFESMEKTLNQYIKKDFARMGCCFYNNQIIGALYVMKCGNRFIYINGGVLKDFQHMNVSHFMHDNMIKDSILLHYKTYDISVGGSVGVINFKEGFGSKLYEFIETKHWVLKPFVFKIYTYFENYLKKYKPFIAKLLMKLKK